MPGDALPRYSSNLILLIAFKYSTSAGINLLTQDFAGLPYVIAETFSYLVIR
ncbi:unannotated protein [freshwater metagenome]|uniref:Unannotated protein n=1 Tax=freshwater metagenome TaxID=449393 RepID=A0A6J7MIE9_9ZZZZ